MSEMRITMRLDSSGPLVDGSAQMIIRDWIDQVKRDIADEGVNRLKSYVMDKTGRGTGHYQAEIVTSTLRFGDIRIHDPLVYGPWLEGTSERNRSTRFKGYRLWRKTRELLEQDAGGIAERRLPELEARLGGGFSATA